MTLKTAAFAAFIATGVLGSAVAANAAVGIQFDIGNVAIGYTDGYYDHDHHWHRWAHHADMDRWRHEHSGDYHAWRHDDRRHHDD